MLDFYWSSSESTYFSDNDSARIVAFDTGSSVGDFKSNHNFVRLVRTYSK